MAEESYSEVAVKVEQEEAVDLFSTARLLQTKQASLSAL